MRARTEIPTTTADPAAALLGITLHQETAPGESEPLLAKGAFRWLPVGDEVTLAPDEVRPVEDREPMFGETLTGKALRRCRITSEDRDLWTDGLPPHEPCPVAPNAETARQSRVLRALAEADLPSVNRLTLVTDVTDDPGSYGLQGLTMHGTYGQGVGSLDQHGYAGYDRWEPLHGQTRHVPIGSIIAACRRVKTGPDGPTQRLWRAWRVPPEGPPYLEWEGADVRNGASWSATAETPQERIARLLDADLDWTFERWLAELEENPDV
ncbi:MAG: hypothetical protein OXG35_01445, partial [Acidobacteria bacterium]|nr:hypothetical protein [Acidobacteriota bacterium]